MTEENVRIEDMVRYASSFYEDIKVAFEESNGFGLKEYDISLSGSLALMLNGFPRTPNDIDFYVDDIQIFNLIVGAIKYGESYIEISIEGHNHARFLKEGWFFDLLVSPVERESGILSEIYEDGYLYHDFIVEKPFDIIMDGVEKSINNIPDKICIDICYCITSKNKEIIELITKEGKFDIFVKSIEKLHKNKLTNYKHLQFLIDDAYPIIKENDNAN